MTQQEIVHAVLDKKSIDYRRDRFMPWAAFVRAGERGAYGGSTLFELLREITGHYANCEFRIHPTTVKTRVYTYQGLDEAKSPRIGVWATTGKATQEETEAVYDGRGFRWLEETQTHELEAL